ncbi:hypothetical protein [Aquimarina sp. 2304DJ70-9]|uniref:hypothetical protein n=1 Tax=Aquimarina penaris TaxID=3231044 RepID=UPI00346200A3
MSLAEKRAMKSFKENIYPDLEKKILDAAGYDLELEVNFDTLGKYSADDTTDYTRFYDNDLPKIYFEPVALALAEITHDEIGKEALQEAVKKLIITNTYKVTGATLEDGVLTFDYRFTNANEVDNRKQMIVQALEKAL